jgi:hypothetical protein
LSNVSPQVSADFLDRELSDLVACGRLSCKIDKVIERFVFFRILGPVLKDTSNEAGAERGREQSAGHAELALPADNQAGLVVFLIESDRFRVGNG